MTKASVAVVGGGIAGLTAAISLRRAGYGVTVFEAAPEIKLLGAGLLLAANAIKSLDKIGIADRVIPMGQQLSRFSILSQSGDILSEIDSGMLSRKYGLGNFSIHRANLHRVLLESLAGVEVKTGKRAICMEQDTQSVTLQFQDGAVHRTQYVLISDGIHSVLRQQLLPGSRPRYAGYTCWRGLTTNPGLALSGASETWAADGRVGIVPLKDDLIYWFICVNATANNAKIKQIHIADLCKRFARYHAPIPQILSATPHEQVLWNDIMDIAPIEHFAFGRALLVGDAAHADATPSTTEVAEGGTYSAAKPVFRAVRTLRKAE
jgi:2-polyprenyl-6-methoxyphenol hydroxylase-like FAD-dependent oxidoreductase